MTRREFIELAKEEGVGESLLCFDKIYKEDAFVVRKDGAVWIVYYCERGDANFKKYYNSESDALIDLLEKFRLMRIRRESW